MRAGQKKALGVIIFLTILGLCVAPFVGMEFITPMELMRGGGINRDIFLSIRLPRTLMAFFAGAGLSLCGMVFQSIFRNELATPFTLGVASGGSLGASLAVTLAVPSVIPFVPAITLYSFFGALGAITLVFGLTQLRRGMSPASTLLAGVAVSFLLSSVTMLIQYVSDFTQLYRIVHWLMGGLDLVGYKPLYGLIPAVMVGGAIIALLHKELDLIATGDAIAASRGVHVNLVKVFLFFVTSVTVGAIVAACGPIGFVGLMAPHMCRILVGRSHSVLWVASGLVGGLFLTLTDTLARTLIAPAEIPVGVLTALLGGPFFLWLLIGSRAGRERL